MGFLGGDNDNEPTRADELVQEQLESNKAEIESKRNRLYQARLGIIKGQGTQQWTPQKETPGMATGRINPGKLELPNLKPLRGRG